MVVENNGMRQQQSLKKGYGLIYILSMIYHTGYTVTGKILKIIIFKILEKSKRRYYDEVFV